MNYCNYCGEPADTYDHVIPIAYSSSERPGAARHGARFGETVPCCRECNNLLGSQVFPSIEDRSHYIAGALKRRYRKLLDAPVWTTDELMELGHGLRSSILADAKRRAVVRERIRYASRA